jgi:hypothetical protein
MGKLLKQSFMKIAPLVFKIFQLIYQNSRYKSKKKIRRSWKGRKKPAVKWWSTNWGEMISSGRAGDVSTAEGKRFRTRFRLPYVLFERLVGICKAHKVFHSHDVNSAGIQSMPVALKVLGALRTLGRGTLHDDVAEMSGH